MSQQGNSIYVKVDKRSTLYRLAEEYCKLQKDAGSDWTIQEAVIAMAQIRLEERIKGMREAILPEKQEGNL